MDYTWQNSPSFLACPKQQRTFPKRNLTQSLQAAQPSLCSLSGRVNPLFRGVRGAHPGTGQSLTVVLNLAQGQRDRRGGLGTLRTQMLLAGPGRAAVAPWQAPSHLLLLLLLPRSARVLPGSPARPRPRHHMGVPAPPAQGTARKIRPC